MPDFLSQDSNLDFKLLNARDCLSHLTKREQQELVDKKTDIEFEAGEIIIKRGLLANNIVYITEGLSKLEIVNNGNESTVAILQPHSFIGIVCCFAFKKFDFTATALTKTKVSFIDMAIFERFIKNNGDFALNLIRHMSGVSNRLLHRITSLSQKNVHGALSYVLLDFARIYNSNDFALPVSRIELANILGYSKESVINTLSKFNKEGILSVNDREIKILNKNKLEQISNFG
jgi:CRP-like cAMP-binding protein